MMTRKILNINQNVFKRIFALKSLITVERKEKITWDEFFNLLIDIIESKGVPKLLDIEDKIINALNDKDKRKLILDVLNGNLKTFRYLNKHPSWKDFLKKAKILGYTKDELISELIQDWYIEVDVYAKGV
jgi:hypothetical protein